MEGYYFVTRLGPAISILELQIRGDTLALEERIVLGPDRPKAPFPYLRGVCLREGKVAFLFANDTIVVTGVVGIFPSLQTAIICWQSPEPLLDDPRWQRATDMVRGAIRKKHHPRII